MNNAHILGTERIGKLLVQYSIPAIIGTASLRYVSRCLMKTSPLTI